MLYKAKSNSKSNVKINGNLMSDVFLTTFIKCSYL